MSPPASGRVLDPPGLDADLLHRAEIPALACHDLTHQAFQRWLSPGSAAARVAASSIDGARAISSERSAAVTNTRTSRRPVSSVVENIRSRRPSMGSGRRFWRGPLARPPPRAAARQAQPRAIPRGRATLHRRCPTSIQHDHLISRRHPRVIRRAALRVRHVSDAHTLAAGRERRDDRPGGRRDDLVDDRPAASSRACSTRYRDSSRSIHSRRQSSPRPVGERLTTCGERTTTSGEDAVRLRVPLDMFCSEERSGGLRPRGDATRIQTTG